MHVGGVTGVIARASTGLAVTFSSGTRGTCSVAGPIVTGVAVGTCTIIASQAGDATYLSAVPVTLNITVSP